MSVEIGSAEHEERQQAEALQASIDWAEGSLRNPSYWLGCEYDIKSDEEKARWRSETMARLASLREEFEPIRVKRESAQRRQRLVQLGWEARVLEAVAEPGFDPTGDYYTALAAIGGNGALLVLSGGVGTGKTCAAGWWASQRRGGARFLRAAAFFRSSRYDDSRDKILREPALVLDDLGAEYADRGQSYAVDFDELCDAFYGDKRTLVITTNIATPAQFAERYGERAMDRIRHCGKWVSSAAPSLRRAPR